MFYDKLSVQSIYQHAEKLTGTCLAEVVPESEIEVNERNRGDLGSLVERYFFEHVPPNNHEPDFAEAGLELKTTGVRLVNGRYRAKERLVLTMIDFMAIVKEQWESSSLMGKCRLTLILFYEYQRDIPVTNRHFVLEPMLLQLSQVSLECGVEIEFLRNHALQIPVEDLKTIQRDWEAIRDKILAGKGHELSEGDTYYLGACRKGSGGQDEALRAQPFSLTRVRSRAFSLKAGYVSKLIKGHQRQDARLGVNAEVGFEEATRRRFEPFFGLTIDEISEKLGHFKKSPNQKAFNRELAARILAAGGQSVVELEKADIEMKTIRLRKHGRPAEHMSFPGFKYLELVNQEWEESSFFEKLEHKFLFVVFRENSHGVERLERVLYWNMPYLDREEAKQVWEETKRRVAIDAQSLPSVNESRVAHVRPKARNARDTDLTPQGTQLVKKCFWLNKIYIASILSEFQ